MSDIIVCRACLNTDVKMVEMNQTSLSEAYFNITGIKVYDPLNYVCFECSALLLKCQNFRDRCLRANNVVINILRTHETITKENFKEINRKLYKLESLYTIHQINFIKYLQEESKFNESDIYDSDYFSAVKMETQSNEEEIKNELSSININLPKNNDIQDNIIIFENALKENIEDILEDESNNVDYASSDDWALKEYVTKKKKKRGRPRKNIEIEQTDKEKKVDKKKGGPKFDMKYFEEYATVVELTPEMAEQEMLSRKVSSNYISCQFKCEMCYRGFEAENTYENHMKKHSDEIGSYECEFCHLKFPNNKALWKHLYSCHKRKFCCKICPYSCFCSSQARLHINLHKGKTYLCNECGESFSMPNSLLMHKRVKHPTECVCAHCGSTFATERGLRSHRFILHRLDKNDKKGPLCEDCNIQFSTETAWKRHLVLSSKHKISNGCEYCGETFENANDLKKHLRVHARKQSSRAELKLPAACPLCSKWLSSRLEYREHIMRAHPTSSAAARERSRHDARAVCETCGAVFKKRCFLIYHQRSHTGERPHECGQCGRTFSQPAALSAHRAAHADALRPHAHACHLCRNTYRARSSLLKHVKAHLGIRPHKCKICDKSFPNRCDVRVHMQYVHYKVPWPKRDRTRRKKSSDEGPQQNTTDCLYNNVNE